MSELLLELREVTVPLRSRVEEPSLTDVNWSVRPGEFWVLGGHHGSGTSDLLLMLAGLAKPLAGTYTLFNQDMGEHFGDKFLPHRLRLGLVFEEARLFHDQTLAENIALPARYHHNLTPDEAEGWVGALLQATELTPLAGQTPSMVGRRWRRRAALARALALRPEVLFLENPLRGLDARDGAWWVTFVQQLWRGHDLMRGQPMTVIASTDEFRPWRESGAQFAVLHGGTLRVAGDGASLDDVTMAHLAPTTLEEDTQWQFKT